MNEWFSEYLRTNPAIQQPPPPAPQLVPKIPQAAKPVRTVECLKCAVSFSLSLVENHIFSCTERKYHLGVFPDRIQKEVYQSMIFGSEKKRIFRA
ncbi:Protein MCM10 [Gossypium australe]|uniref:Protein MCM10 n=1 Tax=Gossypium australe TaxID=47621 RepID=A0A5B6WHN2_9ROSI|nr:Protein MCM10 [Gossypium australe]